jgi:hypothetical protein
MKKSLAARISQAAMVAMILATAAIQTGAPPGTPDPQSGFQNPPSDGDCLAGPDGWICRP